MVRNDAHYFGFVLEVVREDPLESDLSTPLTVTRVVNLRSENINNRTQFSYVYCQQWYNHIFSKCQCQIHIMTNSYTKI